METRSPRWWGGGRTVFLRRWGVVWLETSLLFTACSATHPL